MPGGCALGRGYDYIKTFELLHERNVCIEGLLERYASSMWGKNTGTCAVSPVPNYIVWPIHFIWDKSAELMLLSIDA